MSEFNDDRILEIYRNLNQLQEKYIFYVIALCVSAIGFSVYCTMGKPLHYSQIPLGIAVLAWAFSIFCGLNFVKYAIATKRTNYEQLDTIEHSRIYDRVVTQHINEILGNKLEEQSNKMHFHYRLQEFLFYSGVVCFIIWHIIEMYLTK